MDNALDTALQAAQSALATARANNERVLGDAATARAYDAGLSALGRRPVIPPATVAPPEPGAPRPSDPASVRAFLATADTAAALHAKAARDLAAAEQTAATARERATETHAEAGRVTGLVAAHRRAPTLAAQRKRARLGNLGDVDVIFHGTEAGEPATGPVCEVTIYGRSWDLASRGERVVADLILRCAARRESRMVGVPVVADDVAAWNGGAGPWPATGTGPVYWLFTTDDETLTVHPGKPVGDSK